MWIPIELQKLVDVVIDTEGLGSVQARHHSTVYDLPSGSYMEDSRLDLTAIPARGWQLSHYTG